jgi:hypothetical protein
MTPFRHPVEALYDAFDQGLKDLHDAAKERDRFSQETDMLGGMLNALRDKVWDEMQTGLRLLKSERREQEQAEYDRILMRSA